MNHALPIHEISGSLQDALRASNRLALVAPTGSGKSTQICQILLHSGLIPHKKIVVLQPRRVAARSLAARVAQELGCQLGEAVGYAVRFDQRISAATRIVFATEGMLLRWMQNDPTLSEIGAVLFDEFHERSLLADVSLGLCQRLQQTRPDFKILVMSATLQGARVAQYLACPLLESAGRTFAVDISHADWDDDRPVWERAAERVCAWMRDTHEGDALVFMPGAYEIQACIDFIRRTGCVSGDGRTVVLLPLHGELAPAVQDKVFEPATARRIVVATNVAETSLTIPNITCVVDGGLARVARYDALRGMDALNLERVSQASADQRAGRAGRVAPGRCFRLWSAATHAKLPNITPPEVLRADLCEAVLTVVGMGVRDVTRFQWLDAPPALALHHACDLLRSLGAIRSDDAGGTGLEMTSAGRQMLDIPAHPRHARMLLRAQELGCVHEVALFVAATSGREIFMRLDRGDKLTLRNREAHNIEAATDIAQVNSALRALEKQEFDAQACRNIGVNRHAALEAMRAYEQLLGSLDASKANLIGNWTAARQCHLAGYPDYLAVRAGSGSDEFDLSGERRAELRDDSALRARRARSTLVVASELREIQQRSGDMLRLLCWASAVELDWVRALELPGLSESVEYAFDRLNKRVVAGRVWRLKGLLLGGEAMTDLDPARTAHTLADEFAHVLMEGKPSPQWPKFTQALRDGVKGWSEAAVTQLLARAWHGATSVKEAALREIQLD